MALDDVNFIVCEFALKQPTGKLHLRWDKPDQVFVQVQLPGRGAKSAALRARKWLGQAAGAEALQKRLGLLGDYGSGSLHDFVLYLRRQGKKVATLTWSARDETRDMAELRNLLGQVGHLAFSEALAYYDEAAQLAKSRVYGRAIQMVTTGIQVLGDRYRAPGLRDDTGSHLVLAEHHEKAGKQGAAWGAYHSVLRCRLDAYRLHYAVTDQAGK